MERDTVSWWRRWVVFGPGVAASLLPALLLTPTFAHPGRHLSTLFAFWTELLVTPINSWLPVLLGRPSEFALHPMAGASTWVYAVCLPLTTAHLLKPHALTGWVTAAAFGVWYGWAFLTLGAYECPC